MKRRECLMCSICSRFSRHHFTGLRKNLHSVYWNVSYLCERFGLSKGKTHHNLMTMMHYNTVQRTVGQIRSLFLMIISLPSFFAWPKHTPLAETFISFLPFISKTIYCKIKLRPPLLSTCNASPSSAVAV